MSALASLPPLAAAVLAAAGCAALGVGLGLVYFRGLWWNARMLAGGRSLMQVVALMLGRFVLLAAVLVLVARAGALPLLATASGLLAGRQFVLRRVRGAQS